MIWGYIFGIAIASSAISYTTIYKTQAQRDALAAAYGSNKATSALFGPAPDLQTVAGFTVFKISMTLMVLGAVWGLLTSTRLLRGEEDTGRWELLLAGQTTRRGAAVQALGGLGAGVFALWAFTAVITILCGLDSKVDIAAGPALYFALAMVATAVMFLAVGAVTSQLGATRRQAASYAAVFLGVAYSVRMIADAGVGLHGLIWASPLGWVEELQPLTAPQPLALVPIIGFTALLAVAAVRLAGSRDVGASIVADRATSHPHLRLLSGPTGLAMRTVRPTVIGWWVAIAVSGLLYGLIAKSAGSHDLGVVGPQGLLEARRTGNRRRRRARRVLPHPGRPGGLRRRWAAHRGTLGGVRRQARPPPGPSGLSHLVARRQAARRRGRSPGQRCRGGALRLVGGRQPARRGELHDLLEAGVNLVPPALAIAGMGVLVFGIRPRMMSIVVYALLGWSLLLVIVGGIGAVNHWVLDTSVFHQMASAPAVPPRWEANGIMAAIGVAGALLGGVAFSRRDLQGE